MIVLDNLNENVKNVDYKGFQAEYTKNTPESFVKLIYNSFKWCAQKLSFKELSGKMILEAGTELGVLLTEFF